ncbi:MAG: PQQ-dependent sugar dehydrogenase [Spirochaetes bacterium]|nr:PQQ-dependent sugar dehydrogenase [Spirochaetota bacterium]
MNNKLKYVLGIIAVLGAAVFFGREGIKNKIIHILGAPERYKAEGDPNALQPKYTDADAAREKIVIQLVQVASGFVQPTDIQFSPLENDMALIAEKQGALKWVNLNTKASGILHKFEVISEAEEGLLGIAFHPQFKDNGKIYFNYTVSENGNDTSRIAEWVVSKPSDMANAKLSNERILMRVVQPYSNHNAGQLQFGPDGMLYIGWGDGGFKDDPKGHGQNPKTLLGSMLRVSVEPDASGKPYTVPADNPFVGNPAYAPETFAWGFRNPWRYSFDPKGRLIVADVGQDLFEEIDIVEKGANYGWNIREGAHCFEPKENCKTENLREPVYEYGRKEGQSLTGGYVYTGTAIAALKDKYVFADFVSGRIWAIQLPESAQGKVDKAYTLGQWPVLISAFGRDNGGNLYAADFGSGKILRLAAK